MAQPESFTKPRDPGLFYWAGAMEMEQLAQIFEAVKVLPLRPDDVVVFRVPMKISDENAARIQVELKAYVGADRKVLIISDGCDIEIIRPETEAA